MQYFLELDSYLFIVRFDVVKDEEPDNEESTDDEDSLRRRINLFVDFELVVLIVLVLMFCLTAFLVSLFEEESDDEEVSLSNVALALLFL